MCSITWSSTGLNFHVNTGLISETAIRCTFFWKIIREIFQENPSCHKFSSVNYEKIFRESISLFLGNMRSTKFNRTFCCMHVISFVSNQIYYLHTIAEFKIVHCDIYYHFQESYFSTKKVDFFLKTRVRLLENYLPK